MNGDPNLLPPVTTTNGVTQRTVTKKDWKAAGFTERFSAANYMRALDEIAEGSPVSKKKHPCSRCPSNHDGWPDGRGGYLCSLCRQVRIFADHQKREDALAAQRDWLAQRLAESERKLIELCDTPCENDEHQDALTQLAQLKIAVGALANELQSHGQRYIDDAAEWGIGVFGETSVGSSAYFDAAQRLRELVK